MNIAIIPARSGSKRIPKKNIKDFFGKPMLAYAIEAAINAAIFDTVMVSTDSEEIAEIAQKYGAKVPFLRSAKNASDTATTYDVLEEVLLSYQEQNIVYATVCCIYPCVPFLTGDILKDAYSFMNKYSAVIPVCQYSVPIEWAIKIENNILLPFDKEALNIRSQDLTPKYYDAGMFYFCRQEALLKEKTLITSNTYAYILPENIVQDIDTINDWQMAELKYQVLHSADRT
jgi:N-acylneuraminate cytidylyltransferase